MTALGGGRRAAVGASEVGQALELGAVATLLVAEDRLTDPAMIRLLESARQGKVRVFIVGSEGEAGKRLAGLGSVGGLLRFDFSPVRDRAAPAPPR